MKKIVFLLAIITLVNIQLKSQIKVRTSGMVEIDGGNGSFGSEAPRININSSSTNLIGLNTGLSLFNTDLTNNNWVRFHFAGYKTDGNTQDYVSLAAQYLNHTVGNESADFIIAIKGNGVYAERFRIKYDGKIGIGTSNPVYGNLEIKGDGVNNGLAIYAGSGTPFSFFSVNDIAYITRGGSTTQGLSINTAGHIGINRTPSSSYWLDIGGTLRVNSTVYSSDERLKSNITNIEEKVAGLNDLNAVSYNLKNNSQAVNDNNDLELSTIVNTKSKSLDEQSDRTHFGFLAQELKEVYPEIVYEDENGYLGIDYVSLVPILVEAYKQQQLKISDLEAKMQLMEVELENVTLRLNTPNSFSEAHIAFNLPENIKKAEIVVYDIKGKEVKRINVFKGQNGISLNSDELSSGTYNYVLIADGNIIDSKKMVLSK